MQHKSLLEKYLDHLSLRNFPTMNVLPAYVRLFPLLLGTSSARFIFTPSFSKCSSMQAALISDDSSSSSNKSNLKTNPFYQKYAEKIVKLQRTNPNEYAKRIASLESMHAIDRDGKSSFVETIQKPEAGSDETPLQNSEPKSLDSILNLEKIKPLSSDDIRRLWIEHYANRDAVCAVIPSAAYRAIHAVATLCPVFVYPIPRQDGYEMFVGQFSDDEFHFTLVNYQRHQENALSQLSLKHFTELEIEKGIVLMSGHVPDEGLSVTDAQLLSYLVQHFYVEHASIVKQFNQSPNTFKFEDIIDAMDKTLLMKAGKLTK